MGTGVSVRPIMESLPSQVVLGVRECRQEEEGDYKCVLRSAAHGEAEFDFKLFVTVEGGMDFRAMLLKRKVKQKKVVVKQTEWIEKPVDVMAQERQDEQVVFTARLSEKEKKGKWYLRNNVRIFRRRNKACFRQIASVFPGHLQGHQIGRARTGISVIRRPSPFADANFFFFLPQELHKDDGSKYDMSLKGDVYTLTIFNPTVADSARYTLVVKVDKETFYCSGHLEVKGQKAFETFLS